MNFGAMFAGSEPWEYEAVATRRLAMTLQTLDPLRIIESFKRWTRSIHEMEKAGDPNWKRRMDSRQKVKFMIQDMLNYLRSGKVDVKRIRVHVHAIRNELVGPALIYDEQKVGKARVHHETAEEFYRRHAKAGWRKQRKISGAK